VGLWPALFKSSLQFRLSNTSWRGLRFGFSGSLADAYRAVLPMFFPAVILVGAQTLVDVQHPPQWYLVVVGLVFLSAALVAPWLLWNLKQYQHKHYRLGTQQTKFVANVGSFYMLSLKVLGLVLLVVAVPIATAFALGRWGSKESVVIFVPVAMFLSGLLVLACVKPFAISRLQNMVWCATGNADLRFTSALRFGPLLSLSLKNWLLIVLTLGLYWPFALVAMTRLRLEAVRVRTRIDPNVLVADALAVPVEAAGDAAGDFFGLDVGL